MGRVISVNISREKGTVKTPAARVHLLADHGIAGDAHAGSWHRQVSLLAEESVDTMRAESPVALTAGIFAENITTRGLNLKVLPVGTRLRAGTAELEITQIGKECHSDCAIRQAAGRCVMPTEGVFARVLRGGDICPGDEIEVLS